MREQRQADAVEPGTDQRVDEEGAAPSRAGSSRRSRRAASSTRMTVSDAENDVDGERIRGAIDEALEIDERPGERGDRRTGEDPVESADSRRSRPTGRGFAAVCGARPRAHRIRMDEKKRQHQRDEQKADAVDLGLDDEEDPVERVQRQPDRQGRRQASVNAGQLPDRGLVRRRYCVVPFSRYQRSAPG